MKGVIDAVEDAYKNLAEGAIKNPPRSFVATRDGGDYLFGSCLNLKKDTYIVFGSPFMPWLKSSEKPMVNGYYLYQSIKKGDLLAVVNGEDLVNIRTGAKSAVAVKYLARKNASVLGLIGLGNQSKTQAEAIAAQCKIEAILGYSPHFANRTETFNHIKSKTGLTVQSTSLEEVIKRSDILVVGTHSKTPLVTFEQLHKGQLLISLAHAEEIERSIVKKAKTYVDLRESAMNENSPVKMALADGTDASVIIGELGELITGKVRGRISEDEIIYFQSLGAVHEDLAILEYLYDKLKDVSQTIDV